MATLDEQTVWSWLRAIAVGLRARFNGCCATLLAGVAVAALGSGCAANKEAEPPTATRATGPSVAEPVSPQLLWTHFGKAADEPQATFVVRVLNPADMPVSGAALQVDALDAEGTIVGSKQATMPTLSPRGHFEYLGTLGGRAFSQLTGKPAKIEVAIAASTDSQRAPLLRTSELKLSRGDPTGSATDAPSAYDLTVKVTNDTAQILGTPVHQQVILYDSAGKVAGGDEGSSDNQPPTLQAASSYREEWTGIPAM